MTGDRFITAAEVAEQLGVRAETVLRRFRTGELPGYRLGRPGARVRFRREVVEAWLQRQVVGSEPGEPTVSATVPRSPKQNATMHAWIDKIAAADGRPPSAIKRDLLAAVSTEFGHEITSSRDLTYDEADWALDELRPQLETRGLIPPESSR